MAINAQAFGPAIKTAAAVPKVAGGLSRLFTAPSTFTANDATGGAGAVLGLTAGLVDDPGAKAALSTAAYGAGAVANPFMAAWNLPAFVGGISSLLEGNEAAERRFARTRDAFQVAGPMRRALTTGDFAAPTGGSTAGEGLAAIVNNNLNGTWATDTAHDWLPDLSFLRGQRGLARLGYTGATEPTRGDVGGVGEIVAATGSRMIPPDDAAWVHVPARDEGGSDQSFSRYGDGSAAEGAHGWSLGLRRALGAPPGSTVIPRWGFRADTPDIPRDDVFPWTPQPTATAVQDEGGQMAPTRYETPPGWTNYMGGLEAFDPAIAERVRASVLARDDTRRAQGEG